MIEALHLRIHLHALALVAWSRKVGGLIMQHLCVGFLDEVIDEVSRAAGSYISREG